MYRKVHLNDDYQRRMGKEKSITEVRKKYYEDVELENEHRKADFLNGNEIRCQRF